MAAPCAAGVEEGGTDGADDGADGETGAEVEAGAEEGEPVVDDGPTAWPFTALPAPHALTSKVNAPKPVIRLR